MILTDHAIARYAEHVARLGGPRLDTQRAEAELRKALERPLFYCRSKRGDLLMGARNRHWTFIAACRADGAALEVCTVGPCWYWHEARRYYRRLMASRRHWRRRPS
jgi:hypothetical protein